MDITVRTHRAVGEVPHDMQLAAPSPQLVRSPMGVLDGDNRQVLGLYFGRALSLLCPQALHLCTEKMVQVAAVFPISFPSTSWVLSKEGVCI